jgi:hypothetical protein
MSADILLHGPEIVWPRRPWLARLVFGIDRVLRRRLGVVEYTTHPRCILRISVVRLTHPIVLADGTRAACGDCALDLHLWNEQIPPMPSGGASIAWGRRMALAFETSLRELVRYLDGRRELDGVAILRADMVISRAYHGTQIGRLMSHYGFEVVPPCGPVTFRERARRLGQNILVTLMMMAYHGGGRDRFARDRVQLAMSRRALVRRYGVAHARVAAGPPSAPRGDDRAHSDAMA